MQQSVCGVRVESHALGRRQRLADHRLEHDVSEADRGALAHRDEVDLLGARARTHGVGSEELGFPRRVLSLSPRRVGLWLRLRRVRLCVCGLVVPGGRREGHTWRARVAVRVLIHAPPGDKSRARSRTAKSEGVRRGGSAPGRRSAGLEPISLRRSSDSASLPGFAFPLRVFRRGRARVEVFFTESMLHWRWTVAVSVHPLSSSCSCFRSRSYSWVISWGCSADAMDPIVVYPPSLSGKGTVVCQCFTSPSLPPFETVPSRTCSRALPRRALVVHSPSVWTAQGKSVQNVVHLAHGEGSIETCRTGSAFPLATTNLTAPYGM